MVTLLRQCCRVPSSRNIVFLFYLQYVEYIPDGHLDHLQAGPVYLLDQAEDGRQHVRVLTKTKNMDTNYM